jgi:hypothetical protein
LAAALLVFVFLFEDFSFHTLDPRPARSGTKHRLSSEDSSLRLVGQQPFEPGETFLSTSTQEDLVDGFQTLKDWTAPPLDGDSFSLALGCRASSVPGLQSFEVCGKRRFSEEIAFSLEVWCLLDNLVTLELPRVLAYRFTGR